MLTLYMKTILLLFKLLLLNLCSGCSEALMANAVLVEAARTSGKESIAMESFARALIDLPRTIAENAGYDSPQLISELRAAHAQGHKTYGLGKYSQYSIGIF